MWLLTDRKWTRRKIYCSSIKLTDFVSIICQKCFEHFRWCINFSVFSIYNISTRFFPVVFIKLNVFPTGNQPFVAFKIMVNYCGKFLWFYFKYWTTRRQTLNNYIGEPLIWSNFKKRILSVTFRVWESSWIRSFKTYSLNFYFYSKIGETAVFGFQLVRPVPVG